MLSEKSNSAAHRTRAAIYAHCAEQATSPEAAAALLYLEKMWQVIAEVADIKANSGSRRLPGGDSHPLSPE
jgi:hypothetical protein